MVQKTESLIDQKLWNRYKYELDNWHELLEETGEKPEVLKDVSLKLESGKITALLGRNGAGKTTSIQLILHQYEPTQGRVTLNDRELFEYDQQKYLQQFGVIQQEPLLLYGYTIRENLLLGSSRPITDQEIWSMLERLLVDDVIRQLPNQLNTLIGEETRLSGGQEQLLAVARVFLQQRNILIFDEGMSQMDIEHETRVVELLQESAKTAAVLFVTHRITTARKADYIYMLDQGKIAEEGTHKQLLEHGGLYAKFWKMQIVE